MHRNLMLVLMGGFFLIAGCGPAGLGKRGIVTPDADPVRAVCEANGLLRLAEHSTLHFTFNVQLPDKTVSRRWRWDIKADAAYLDGAQVASDDKRFVNDKYWLLFPLMAHYDRERTRVSVDPESTSPLGGQTATEITIAYTDGGGYTPNDVYKLYHTEDMRVFEWAYYKGGKAPPARVTEWTAYGDFNGISLSLTRPSAGEFKVWFTDVRIE